MINMVETETTQQEIAKTHLQQPQPGFPTTFPPPSALNPPVSENGKGQKRSGKTDRKYIQYIYTYI